MAINVRSMLQELSAASLCGMYSDPVVGSFVCKSVFRLLGDDHLQPPIAQVIVMRLLPLSDPLPSSIVQSITFLCIFIYFYG
jgi:hypothetical protein